ncbi:MAG TPA: NUDIX domain-containing protein [Streptosporangiaceae bacterium]|jgi:septum formation protein
MSGWLKCPVHGRHWGEQDAAGLLPFTVTPSGIRVLLALRSEHTHLGGTWSTIGGAIDQGETPWEAAVREAGEEVPGLDLAGARAADSHRYACVSGWSYTTFVVPLPSDAPVTIGSGWATWETAELRWVPLEEVDGYPLLPAFAQSWPDLRKLIEAQASPS